LAEEPDLISIDAPLSLPRGRVSVSDDSPCHAEGGIVRDAERILWSRGIRVYPALIRQMQGLTSRGIQLAKKFREYGIPVIESYPGAAQDVLNIPRKKLDEDLLARGLRQFGYQFSGRKSHDELDAITSALVGHFYLANKYEALGADDEGYMINPSSHSMSWNPPPKRHIVVSLVGLPGAGKTTLSRTLESSLGWEIFILGDALRAHANKDAVLRSSLESGQMAPECLVSDLVSQAIEKADGCNSHTEQTL
jgi:predicted nuclease with RNAse H fold